RSPSRKTRRTATSRALRPPRAARAEPGRGRHRDDAMELRFVGPDLAELDRVGAEVLVAALFRDERPPRGVAGLFDWRSAGRLSRLLIQGFATGELGEVLMTPAKPCLPFDKVIFFGAGNSAEFDDVTFSALVERILS